MECNYSGCEEEATQILAMDLLGGRSVLVAPYCDKHPDPEMGARPAAGPALSEEARKIEGIRG